MPSISLPHTAQMREVIVIGSGFGGAIAALRLAEAGHEVTVLERGKRWGDAKPFATYEAPDGRAAWLSTTTVDPLRAPTSINRYAGLLDCHKADGITVLTAAGVGGGSLAFTGALVQPDLENILQIFPWLDLNHLQRCYNRVRAIIKPEPVPEDLLKADPHFYQARLFSEWVNDAGLLPITYDMALDWDIVRKELSGEINAAYTAGQSWYGINSGAKKSLDKNYLALAEATGHTEIRSLHVVQSIAEADQARFDVSGIEISEDGTPIGSFTYTSEMVFLAAGSLGTSELLLRARAEGTLPNLASNAAIGKMWGNSGDVVGIHPSYAFHSRHMSQAGEAQVAAGIGTLRRSMQGQVFLLGDANNGGAPDSLLSLSMAMPSNTRAHTGLLTYHASTHQIHIHWDQVICQRLKDLAEENYTHLNTRVQLKKPLSSIPRLQATMTAHPLGGIVLGEACHQYTGQVVGYEHLYVVDGSLFPGWAGGVPPALTIAALAEYLLDQFDQCTYTPKRKQ